MSRGGAVLLTLSVALMATPALAQEPANDCAPKDLSKLSLWSGVWIAEQIQTDVNGRELPGSPPFTESMKFLGLEAPWNDEGWARMESQARPIVGGFFRRASWGFPLMMSSPSEFKFIISLTETAIITNYREVRYIYTDGRQHPPTDEEWPTLWGHSIGCWEGDTLVIDTVAVKYVPPTNDTPPILVSGAPFSANARFTERLRMTGPARIEGEFTVTDPATLERPWNVHMVYIRHPVLKELTHEGEVFDNDRMVADEGGLTIADAGEPQAPPRIREVARLSEVELDRVVGRYTLDGSPLELAVERRGDRMLARVIPAEPGFFPIYPADPLNYFSRIHEGTLRFTMDASGRVAGFTGTNPFGEPISGKRKRDNGGENLCASGSADRLALSD